jgi:protein-tyrosine-phosphatase
MRFKILFLCTGNSARSILGEFLLRHMAGDRFETFSAGADPTGVVNPFALRVLREVYGIEPDGARSKSWEACEDVDLDFVITVCDNARESCPVWPGKPIIAHWGMPDPAAIEGSDEEKFEAFRRTALEIHRRLELLISLPMGKLEEERERLQGELDAIGRS